MFEVVNEIPKELERVVLEEYYHFFQNLYGSKSIFSCKLKFINNPAKHGERENRDIYFQMALKVLDPYKDNIKYLLLKDENGLIVTVARIKIGKNYILFPDSVNLDYPTDEEQEKRWSLIINFLMKNAGVGCSDLCCEVPWNDQNIIDIAIDMGFKPSEVQNKERYYTEFLSYDLIERRYNGTSRNRKQV